MKEIMDVGMKIACSIQARTLQRRLFRAHLEMADCDNSELLLHTDSVHRRLNDISGAKFSEHCQEVVKPYDWTFTTDYRGTLIGEELQIKVTETTERINLEKLRAREQIVFFDEVLLFEDELHDHGVSMISVKIRVMPTSFFTLLRFFLRVDGVLIRINDTRLYHEAGQKYMLREFCTRESKIAELKSVPASLYTDPNEIAQHLTFKLRQCEKLELPEQEHDAVNEDL
ncbi:TIP41-like protein [Phyllopteryx taeniolatus]|uniref:TIP41-like protein n=1 Tax=Phyllopteryx taeniolatus TaxID=161469 RepID=UPI002AD40C5C|nr:TIP41-like protein [Phyllopteryx taeniolatus]